MTTLEVIVYQRTGRRRGTLLTRTWQSSDIAADPKQRWPLLERDPSEAFWTPPKSGETLAHLCHGVAGTGVVVQEYTLLETGTPSPTTVVPVRWATERGNDMATAKKPAAKKSGAPKKAAPKKAGGAKKR